MTTSAGGPARVLWLAKGLGRGGAERLLASSAACLDQERFRVEVAYLLPYKDALVEEIRSHGVAVHCLEQRSPADLGWVVRLRALLRARDYRLVHTHMPVPATAARLLVRRPTALVHTEHNVWSRYRLGTRVANAVTYPRNDAVLAVSQAVLDSVPAALRPRPPRTCEVLVHGIDATTARRGAAARERARAVLGLPADAPVIGTVANFTAKKDQRTLLEAVAALRADLPEVRLVLVGTGPLEAALRAHADAVLPGAALFTGMRDDVPELLPAFDVFTLSSLHEGLPVSLVEALAAGVPAVCTRVGGVPEVLTDGREGLLVPPSDPAALTAALRRVLAEPELHATLAGRAVERAADFDISRATARIADVYAEVLAR